MWNIRRHILQGLFAAAHDEPAPDQSISTDVGPTKIVEDLVVNDLEFLMPLMRKFPKCYWIWNYRLWLLEQSKSLLSSKDSYLIWQRELSLVGKMLSLDSRNFHGWGYRRTVVAALESFSINDTSSDKNTTEQEFDYTTKMIESNLSNFSAWHRRSKLILRLLHERHADQAERRRFLDKGYWWSSKVYTQKAEMRLELELIKNALWADPESKDQSLWFYHQYLVSAFDPARNRHSIAPNLTLLERKEYIERQIEDLREMLDGAESCKWIYQRLIELCLVYRSSIGSWPIVKDLVRTWISELIKLDPMRKGRWLDLSPKLES